MEPSFYQIVILQLIVILLYRGASKKGELLVSGLLMFMIIIFIEIIIPILRGGII